MKKLLITVSFICAAADAPTTRLSNISPSSGPATTPIRWRGSSYSGAKVFFDCDIDAAYLNREINIMIHNKLGVIKSRLLPLINSMSGLVPTEKAGINPVYEDERNYLRGLCLEMDVPAQKFQNMPINDKIEITKQLDYSIDVFLGELKRLINIFSSQPLAL